MWVSKLREEDLSVETVDRLLFQGLEDTGEKADVILVLGSEKAAAYRVPVAVRAYRAGRADKLLLCGGTVRDFPSDRCRECEHMNRAALEAGVAQEDIVLEKASQNTVENIRFALAELQSQRWERPVHRVLLVTTAYHMRRSLAIARHLFPAHIAVAPCPANDTHTRRDNWMHTPAGFSRARAEAMNIVGYIHRGIIPDFEI